MSAVESENYLAPWYRENPLAKVNLEQLKDLSQWVPLAGSNYVQIRQIMMNASEEAVFKQNINVADHLKAAEKRANALMPK
jgi:multiple sugar transport system substrate-binding protein